MTLKMFGVVASLSAAALTLSVGEAFARDGRGAGVVAAPFARAGVPFAGRPFAHHQLRRGFASGFWPAGGFYYGGGTYSEPLVDSSLPLTNDIKYTYTYKQDVPWDWAHRFPPAVAPSDRQYVPSCTSEPVTVPGRSGEQTVNVIRCY